MKARLWYLSFCCNNSIEYLTFMTLTLTICTTILHRSASSIHTYTIEYKTRLILHINIDCIVVIKKKAHATTPLILIMECIYHEVLRYTKYAYCTKQNISIIKLDFGF